MAATLDDNILLSMARAAQNKNLWSAVLPVVAVLGAPHQKRLVNLPIMHELPVLSRVLDTAEQDRLWPQLLPLLPMMDEAGQECLAVAAEQLDDTAFGHVFEAVNAARSWAPLIVLLLRMREEVRARIRPLISRLSPDQARGILQQADQLGVLKKVESLWASLSAK